MSRDIDSEAALARVRPYAWRTPVMYLDPPGAQSDGQPGTGSGAQPGGQPDAPPVALKLESLQHTGSFKVRGAANRLHKLSGRGKKAGVVAASSGNHGRAVAVVAARMGVPATICVPDWVDPSKLRAIRAARARVVLAGPSYDAAEDRAAAIADASGASLIPAFDDVDVIEGQGTLGPELLRQMPDIEEVVIPLSGGGLVAGIGLALGGRGIRVVAVSARRASVMFRSLEAGRPIRAPDEETVASALSGGIGLDNRFTLEICSEVITEHVIVEESDIKAAVRHTFREHHLVVEGGGAVGLAALWSGRYRPRGPAAVIVSGGNVDRAVLKRLVTRG